jgi:hypothetical protein
MDTISVTGTIVPSALDTWDSETKRVRGPSNLSYSSSRT